MAVVYLAEDERLDREVAVKRLHADSTEDVEIRFVREAKLGASLNHPNLVWVFDILTDDEGLVIVMEYVDGPHLGRELSSGPLQPRPRRGGARRHRLRARARPRARDRPPRREARQRAARPRRRR